MHELAESATADPVVLGATTLQAGAIKLFGVMIAACDWYLLVVPLGMSGPIITALWVWALCSWASGLSTATFSS